MIQNMTTLMHQGASISSESWTPENVIQLLSILKDSRGMKLTLSFENEEKSALINQDSQISRHLSLLGIGRHLNGYSYLKTGIRHCLDFPEELESVTKLLYPAIAKEHQTTAGRVEHGIRHAIGLAWEERNKMEWEKIFGYRAESAQGRPTNTEFLAALSDYILLGKGMQPSI